MLFSSLWDYRNSAKIVTRFTPFQLVYGVEAVLSIKYKIPSLKLIIELFPNTSIKEESLLDVAYFDEQHHDATLANETCKKCFKSQYEKYVCPRVFLQEVLQVTL